MTDEGTDRQKLFLKSRDLHAILTRDKNAFRPIDNCELLIPYFC